MTADRELTDRFVAACRSAGADLVGIAPIERFEGIDPQHHPRSIFPEVRNVIVLAKRITRGCIRGVEEGTQMSQYATYAMNWLPDRFLAITTVSAASFLEDHRWEAVPLPCLPKQAPPMGIPVKPGAPAPNVMIDFADAAVRAGLGEIGYSGELMTPEFGHLQRLQMILTDAPLVGGELFTGTVCDRCGQCAAACPLGAFSAEAGEVEICGRRMTVAAIDASVCARCRNGAWPNPHHPSGTPDRLAAACMRACLCHLEQEGLLTRKFRNQFRSRPAWRIGPGGVPELEGEA